MQIKFESGLLYQQEAINAIIDIFQGQEICTSNSTIYSPEYLAKQKTFDLNQIGYANKLQLSEVQILENAQKIQFHNGLKPSLPNEVDLRHLDFSIEMETGTGKTYVYLRTIMEMNRQYGFTKFIIVVPSIPIKEGVYKSLQITESHFKEHYNNIPYRYFIYDSANLSNVRDFAINDQLQIMVINIDAFRKSFENEKDKTKNQNIIHRYNDKLGYKPLQLIQDARPVVIIDEPQTTLSTEHAKKSVSNLNPLVMLRYSATHKEKLNLMYKLDAVDAYNRQLVKQIEVASVKVAGAATDGAYMKLISVQNKPNIRAKLELDILGKSDRKRKPKELKKGDDLLEITKLRQYEGFIVRDIYTQAGNEYIEFINDTVLKPGEAVGSVDDGLIKRMMIRKTIEEHLDKELVLNPKGIKVLSLFFIDAVKHYRLYDDEGNMQNGDYANLFEEEYKRIIQTPKYQNLVGEIKDLNTAVHEIHNGYFSIDKKAKASNKKEKFEYYKDTSGNMAADEDTYNVIMKDKEKLLSFDSKLRFIFSHSALKEGWDNPNVFQICTLKEAGSSEIRRRQEIGRGLRLAVNQAGERVYGFDTNTLTVMASESYEEFVENLQKEIEEDAGIVSEMLQPIKRNEDKQVVRINEKVLSGAAFKQLWDQLKFKTTYSVHFDSELLIKACQQQISDMPVVSRGSLDYEKASLDITKGRISVDADTLKKGFETIDTEIEVLPDIVSYLQHETQLTRKSIVAILSGCNNLRYFKINPQQFIERCIDVINEQMHLHIVDGIVYSRVGEQNVFDQDLFQHEQITGYLKSNMLPSTKSPYEHVIYDNTMELELAKEFESNQHVKVYVKLPGWFTIDTPLGPYHPDWAVLLDINGTALSVVVESKGTMGFEFLRPVEQGKITCGKKHFGELAKKNGNNLCLEYVHKMDDFIEQVVANVDALTR
jgi:restriction endonuclease